MDKKLIITGQIILFLIFISSNVSATWTLTESNWNCGSDNCCVEGDSFGVTITIKNTDPNTFNIDEAYIIDKNGNTIASNKGISFALAKGESKTFTVSGILPTPSSGTGSNAKLEYKYKFHINYDCFLCMWKHEETGFYSRQLISKSDHGCDGDVDCSSKEHCSISNCVSECEPIPCPRGYISDHKCIEYECMSDSDCGDEYQCKNYKCVLVPCECGYRSGHACIKYDCCSDSDCGTGKYCDNHKCYNIECENNDDCDNDEKCEGYTCVKLKCGSCEYVSDHRCVRYDCCTDADCGTGKYCSNHKCYKHECMSDSDCLGVQKCSNHKCTPLSCGECEYATNHQCVKYDCCSNNDCKSNQHCDEKHTCSDLVCNSIQTIKNHKCELNLPIVWGIGIAVLIVIIVLIIGIRKKR